MSSRRATPRTRAEVVTLVTRYVTQQCITVSQLSAYALGDGSVLSRFMRDPNRRIYLDTVDRLLRYIEQNPGKGR